MRKTWLLALLWLLVPFVARADLGTGFSYGPTVPTSCTEPQLFLDTNGASGLRWYICEGGSFRLYGTDELTILDYDGDGESCDDLDAAIDACGAGLDAFNGCPLRLPEGSQNCATVVSIGACSGLSAIQPSVTIAGAGMPGTVNTTSNDATGGTTLVWTGADETEAVFDICGADAYALRDFGIQLDADNADNGNEANIGIKVSAHNDNSTTTQSGEISRVSIWSRTGAVRPEADTLGIWITGEDTVTTGISSVTNPDGGGPLIRITTDASHFLMPSDSVELSGTSTHDGTYVVEAVPSATTYDITSADTGAESCGSCSIGTVPNDQIDKLTMRGIRIEGIEKAIRNDNNQAVVIQVEQGSNLVAYGTVIEILRGSIQVKDSVVDCAAAETCFAMDLPWAVNNGQGYIVFGPNNHVEALGSNTVLRCGGDGIGGAGAGASNFGPTSPIVWLANNIRNIAGGATDVQLIDCAMATSLSFIGNALPRNGTGNWDIAVSTPTSYTLSQFNWLENFTSATTPDFFDTVTFTGSDLVVRNPQRDVNGLEFNDLDFDFVADDGELHVAGDVDAIGANPITIGSADVTNVTIQTDLTTVDEADLAIIADSLIDLASEVTGDLPLGTNTSGNYVDDVTGGAGIAVSHSPGEGSDADIATASQETGFLADGGVTSLTCGGTNTGRAQVMDDGDLEWCDGNATAALQSVDSKITTHTSNASAHHAKTVDASELSTGTIAAARVGTDHIDELSEIATALKSGLDSELITGTIATTNAVVTVNADDDLVELGAPLTYNITAATCTGDGNGGALTVNGSNEIICSADDGGGSSFWSQSGGVIYPTTSTDDVGNDASGTNWLITDAGAATFAGTVTSGATATPTVALKDSDMGGTPDNNIQIIGNCPTGTTAGGDEDCDATLTVQSGGTITGMLMVDTTDGAVSTVNIGATTAIGTPPANALVVGEGGETSFAGTATFTAPSSAGAAPSANGLIAYDSTSHTLEYGANATNRTVANLGETQTFDGNKTFSGAGNAFTGGVSIPNGPTPTLDAAGEIAVDSSDGDADQLVYDDGTNEYVLVPEQTKCATIETLADTDDDIPLHGFLDASTITAVACTVRGTTPTATVVFTDGTNTVKSVTCGTTATTLTWDRASLTNTAYTANEVIELDTTSTGGTITWAQACFAFRTDRQ